MPWTITMRTSGRVERDRYSDLEEVLDALEARVEKLVSGAPRRPVDVRYRKFDPGEQVYARIEMAGPERLLPRVRAGIDVRGDGSTEPYLGGLRRRVLERRGAESAVAALRRVLGS
jgi:hypothetical protein